MGPEQELAARTSGERNPQQPGRRPTGAPTFARESSVRGGPDALLCAGNSSARRGISRGIPVHLFALKFGIIGMRSHSRKEATERSRTAAGVRSHRRGRQER
jgi:hypothetical protein